MVKEVIPLKERNYDSNKVESIQIGIASPEVIKEWSYGEVKSADTINHKSSKPEQGGLFCEKIFGPSKNWECSCRKLKGSRFKGLKCEACGVEITKSKVRRERMGHIELATPVSHIWFFKGSPSRLGLVLDLSGPVLEKVLYYASYIVTDPGDTPLKYKQILTEQQYIEAESEYGNRFKAGMGAEAIREILEKINVEESVIELREQVKTAIKSKKSRLIKRLEIMEAFRASGNRPEWMILQTIPVIPPDLRPLVQLDGGRFATADLNDLYRRLIIRNNRLKRLIEIKAADLICRNEKRMIQEAVDSLFDNGRRGKPVTAQNSKTELKSLTHMLKGKQGRLRQNLLGKRVDYSGRSVIVVGPDLKFHQCGLPKKMALKLFDPFVMKELSKIVDDKNGKSARRMIEREDDEVWDVLEKVVQEHPVLLNRAPTLHRLGIQAFEPVLVDGKAIKLHPLVCTAFNADFDGDQMAVHVPLSVEAQAEARFLMLSTNNILAPKDGYPITTPTQDMILGTYYLTHKGSDDRNTPAEKGDGKVFSNIDEMLMAYQNGTVGIHALVKVRCCLEGDTRGKLIESTVGRFIFNQGMPQNLGFVDRNVDPYALEIDFLCDKKALGVVINKCHAMFGNARTAQILDYIKDMGYKYATKAAITISVSDMEIPSQKDLILEGAEKKVDEYEKLYRMGLMSNDERYEKVVDIWNKATDDVADALIDALDPLNNLFIMADSGARGSKNQIKQVGGMRGLMTNASGRIVEVPIKSNFREGLSVLEYFISSNGARKGLIDTALRTADSGYLTRRLVDVSHNMIVGEVDCGSTEGTKIRAFADGKQVIEPLHQRIMGRISLEDIIDPETKETIVRKGEMITTEEAERIEKKGIEEVTIRSAMGCKCKVGICTMCYGKDLATGEMVNIGEPVGITAAQSIGEPGTQLTMRTFHTGGVAGSDITQGLPRVEELFEARTPKGLAQICEAEGKVVSITPNLDNTTEIIIEGEETITYNIPYGAKIVVSEGDIVKAGDNVTAGPLSPNDILRIKGVEGVYNYLLREVQRVYKQQGVDINDKHIEIIVNQMLSMYKVVESNDTELLPEAQCTKTEIDEANEIAVANGLEPATYKRLLLPITKNALSSHSFLSAASFQETTKVLTDAAIKGKKDKLQGLKENVIIGKLIPAGTGLGKYKSVEIDYGEYTEMMEEAEIQNAAKEDDGLRGYQHEPTYNAQAQDKKQFESIFVYEDSSENKFDDEFEEIGDDSKE